MLSSKNYSDTEEAEVAGWRRSFDVTNKKLKRLVTSERYFLDIPFLFGDGCMGDVHSVTRTS